MTYTEALELVRTEFETKHDAAHNEVVLTGMTYDGCNGVCVCIYNYGDRIMVTDIGETAYFFSEVEEEEWKSLCAEHGFEFNHWRIETPFNSLEDLYSYIEFIDFISDKYCGLDDLD